MIEKKRTARLLALQLSHRTVYRIESQPTSNVPCRFHVSYQPRLTLSDPCAGESFRQLLATHQTEHLISSLAGSEDKEKR
jgi:hypothetical protein